MASACVNNIGMSPENAYPPFDWLSPRISFSRDLPAVDEVVADDPSSPPLPDPEASAADFEFRLQDPVAMLPADQLFSDGKLVPLRLSSSRPSPQPGSTAPSEEEVLRRRTAGTWDVDVADPCIFSPKAPRCSSRWKELLGLKKLYHQSGGGKSDSRKEAATATAWSLPSHGGVSSSASSSGKPIRRFLHKHSKSTPPSSSSDASLSVPLLPYSDCEFVSFSSRLSLSSSSSSSGAGHGHQEFDDHPRLSLDSDQPNHNPQSKKPKQPNPNPNPNPARARVVSKPRGGGSAAPSPSLSDQGVKCARIPRRAPPDAATARGAVSADSPRMNSSGKVVFHGLERSTSSPCSFNGGPRFKPRGMERSYSANVRVTPVLNVPVCSLIGSAKSAGVFGFGQLFGGGGGSGSTRTQLIGNHNCRNRG